MLIQAKHLVQSDRKLQRNEILTFIESTIQYTLRCVQLNEWQLKAWNEQH